MLIITYILIVRESRLVVYQMHYYYCLAMFVMDYKFIQVYHSEFRDKLT